MFYTVALCKPVLPLFKDMMAHVFWKAEHIATVHQHAGKHHPEKEIAGLSHEEENKNNAPSSKISEPVSIHIVVRNTITHPYVLLREQLYSQHLFFASSPFLEKSYPPPKSC